jgi:MFS family permease
VWLAVTAFSLALILGRAAVGHVPDRFGGAKVALVCVFIQAAGLASVAWAPGATVAFAGVTVAGLGYALVYPSLGVEAMRDATSQSRGVVMGAYTAFLDVSLGVSSPVLGWIAAARGLSSVFLASASTVAASNVAAVSLIVQARNATARKISL